MTSWMMALNGVPKNAGRYSSVFTTSTAGAPENSADHRELRLRAHPTAASHRFEPHQDALVASRRAARPASRRSRAAPNAAETVTSNTSS